MGYFQLKDLYLFELTVYYMLFSWMLFSIFLLFFFFFLMSESSSLVRLVVCKLCELLLLKE